MRWPWGKVYFYIFATLCTGNSEYIYKLVELISYIVIKINKIKSYNFEFNLCFFQRRIYNVIYEQCVNTFNSTYVEGVLINLSSILLWLIWFLNTML